MNTPELDRLSSRYRQIISVFVRGDEGAVRFLTLVLSIMHIWDDLIDHDKQPTDDEVMAVFQYAVLDLPVDPFYRTNCYLLHPILMNSVVSWRAAIKLERKGDNHDRQIAFILRGAYMDLIGMCAYIVGGREWAAEVTVDIRRWGHVETFTEYLEHLWDEMRTRQGLPTESVDSLTVSQVADGAYERANCRCPEETVDV